MTVKGDLIAALTSAGRASPEEAKELIMLILHCAADPDFAIDYARWEGRVPGGDFEQGMVQYWSVIRFLASTL